MKKGTSLIPVLFFSAGIFIVTSIIFKYKTLEDNKQIKDYSREKVGQDEKKKQKSEELDSCNKKSRYGEAISTSSSTDTWCNIKHQDYSFDFPYEWTASVVGAYNQSILMEIREEKVFYIYPQNVENISTNYYESTYTWFTGTEKVLDNVDNILSVEKININSYPAEKVVTEDITYYLILRNEEENPETQSKLYVFTVYNKPDNSKLSKDIVKAINSFEYN